MVHERRSEKTRRERQITQRGSLQRYEQVTQIEMQEQKRQRQVEIDSQRLGEFIQNNAGVLNSSLPISNPIQ